VVFVAVQAVVIVHGVISVGVFIKISGYPEFDNFRSGVMFVRHAGFLMLLVPAAWVWLTVWYEGTSQSGPKVLTISTGVLVVLYLVLFFVDSVKVATLVH
jgi:hypothetical protein